MVCVLYGNPTEWTVVCFVNDYLATSQDLYNSYHEICQDSDQGKNIYYFYIVVIFT